jgi:hypothetical protein
MELYLNWIIGSGATHDQFYTDKKVISSYRSSIIHSAATRPDSLCRALRKDDCGALQVFTEHLRMGARE